MRELTNNIAPIFSVNARNAEQILVVNGKFNS